MGGAPDSASSCVPGLLGPPLSRKWSCVLLLPPSGWCWPHVSQAKGPGEHKGPPEHPEGLATGCLSAEEPGPRWKAGRGCRRAPRSQGHGPGSPSQPHCPFRIRRVFLSPMKNLQKHGPVRSLGESPRPSSASPCPDFSRIFPAPVARSPWGRRNPFPGGAISAIPELLVLCPPSHRLSRHRRGADGGSVDQPPSARAPPHPASGTRPGSC